MPVTLFTYFNATEAPRGPANFIYLCAAVNDDTTGLPANGIDVRFYTLEPVEGSGLPLDGTATTGDVLALPFNNGLCFLAWGSVSVFPTETLDVYADAEGDTSGPLTITWRLPTGGPENQVYVLPTPTLFATVAAPFVIDLNWTPVATPDGYWAVFYHLERATDPAGPWDRILSTTDPATLTYTDTDVFLPTYYYRVVAHEPAIVSGSMYSPIVTVHPGEVTPVAVPRASWGMIAR